MSQMQPHADPDPVFLPRWADTTKVSEVGTVFVRQRAYIAPLHAAGQEIYICEFGAKVFGLLLRDGGIVAFRLVEVQMSDVMEAEVQARSLTDAARHLDTAMLNVNAVIDALPMEVTYTNGVLLGIWRTVRRLIKQLVTIAEAITASAQKEADAVAATSAPQSVQPNHNLPQS